MNRLRSILLMIGTLTLLGSHPANAGTVYSAPPDQSGATDMNNSLVADSFTLGVPAQIAQIQFWALQDNASSYTGSIAWSINSDASGVPGSILVSGTSTPTAVPTGLTFAGSAEFVYLFSVPVTPLSASTIYWLVLHNGPTNAIPSTNMAWENSNGNSGNSQTMDLALASQPWLANFSSLAFNILDVSAVPEPGTMLLLSAGLAGGILLRRRRTIN